MVLLYFKVASALLSAPCDVEVRESIGIPMDLMYRWYC
jgi:hypothetical protein